MKGFRVWGLGKDREGMKGLVWRRTHNLVHCDWASVYDFRGRPAHGECVGG